MKSITEIQGMLVSELYNNKKKIKQDKSDLGYFNEKLGDTSFLLAALLDSHLKEKFDEWDSRNWIDDSLIEAVKINNNDILELTGVMIWGIEDDTEQWTDPFLFNIELKGGETGFVKYTFLFGDLNISELSYEYFRYHRSYWNEGEREWKYIINYNNLKVL